MVEKILVKGQLTNEMLEAGRNLLARLKESNLEAVAAYWLYNIDAGEWRLTLAMPDVDMEGSLEVYSNIWQVLSGNGEKPIGLDLSNITVVSPNDRFVRALASITQDHDLSNTELAYSVIDKVYIEDMYLYFVGDSVKPLNGSS